MRATLEKWVQKNTVHEELAQREQCRYGLRGVHVEYDGKTWKVAGSEWDQKGDLRLCLLPVDYHEDNPPGKLVGGLRIMSAAELDDYKFPECGVSEVDARDVILRSEWPHVCCCYIF